MANRRRLEPLSISNLFVPLLARQVDDSHALRQLSHINLSQPSVSNTPTLAGCWSLLAAHILTLAMFVETNAMLI